MNMKNIVIAVVALSLFVGGLFVFTQQVTYNKPVLDTNKEKQTKEPTETATTQTEERQFADRENDTVTSQSQEDNSREVIGTSAGGNDIVAYHYGSGDTELLFIGGIHAGYAPNTVLVAYELMDYLDNPDVIPDGVRVTVIPTLNPDGQKEALGTAGAFTQAAIPQNAGSDATGRFNANKVDLNRNFDCAWQSKGVWRNTPVSGGIAAFSEPESAALRDYVSQNKPDAVIAYYAAAGGVYASTCSGTVDPETITLMQRYANAAGYPAQEEFDYYEVTGDMVNWFAKQGIPAISVLLSDYTNTEWSKNKKGVEAVLSLFSR